MKKTDATYLDTVVGRAVALGMLVGGGLIGLLGVALQSFGAAPALSEDAVARMQEDRIWSAYRGVTDFPEFPGYGMGWWVDRDRPIVSDFGAYGTNPWLDLERGYGAVVFLEGESWMGTALYLELEPILADHFDAGA